MNDTMLEVFLQRMREDHGEDIAAVDLPEGSREYLEQTVANNDVDALEFAIKLAYIIGLRTGYAVSDVEEELEKNSNTRPNSPLRA